jgi:arylsulfatase A-like enzyme
VRQGSTKDDGLDQGPWALVAQGAGFAVCLTAALGVAGYASGDRYPGYYVSWTAALLGAAFVVPLGVLGAAAPWLRGMVSGGALASAFCVLLGGALSLDVAPEVRVGTRLGAARLLLLVAGLALAAWNLKRGRVSRLGLGAALAALCAAWMLCGLLRSSGVPEGLSRPAILLPLAAAAALLLPGLPRLDPASSRSRLWATAAAGAVLVLLPLSPRVLRPEMREAKSTAAPAGGRSAVLIVLDTLRRDHMSLYGYPRKTTPRLDEKASKALVFDDSTSVASWTLPSHASMFTGLWPRTHGANSFRGEMDQATMNVNPLARERVTLAEIALEHGYRTAGFSSNATFLSTHWGLDQGFQEYVCRRPRLPGVLLGLARDLAWKWGRQRAWLEEAPYFTAPEMSRAAIAWLERRGDAPFFLFLNYMDAHRAPPGRGRLPFEGKVTVTSEERARRVLQRNLAAGAITAAERASLVDEYDREVTRLDEWVSALLDYIEESGLAATTQVIVTSDHGEFLGDHQEMGHGKDLYAEVVNVPLIVWEPGSTPARVSRPAQSPDLFPTILRYLGLPIPEGTQGQPALEVDHPTVSEQYDSRPALVLGDEGHTFDRILRTIRVGGHRYHNSSKGEERLFDLTADPHETRNLISARPDVAASARRRLAEWVLNTAEARAPVEPPQKVDAEAVEGLRALGYVQ